METRGLNSIYYVRPEMSVAFRMDDALANPDDLLSTHKFVINTEHSDPEEVFVEMQSENWSPNGEARGLIKSLALEHTSMSVGDVVVIDNIPYQALPTFGFVNLKTGKRFENETDVKDVVVAEKVGGKYASMAAIQSSINIDSPWSGIKEILNQMLSHDQSLGLDGLKRAEVKVLAGLVFRSMKDLNASRIDSEEFEGKHLRIRRGDIDRAVEDIAQMYCDGFINITEEKKND